MYVTVYMACSLSLLLLETKPHVLFVFEVYLLEHLVMDFSVSGPGGCLERLCVEGSMM